MPYYDPYNHQNQSLFFNNIHCTCFDEHGIEYKDETSCINYGIGDIDDKGDVVISSTVIKPRKDIAGKPCEWSAEEIDWEILKSKVPLSERKRYIDNYINPFNVSYQITTPNMALNQLVDLYSQLLQNTSRLVFLYFNLEAHIHSSQLPQTVLNQNIYHVVIIARTTDTIYMLDPKHRVIMKNSDIWKHPWLDIDFYTSETSSGILDNEVHFLESFKWNQDNSYTTTGLVGRDLISEAQGRRSLLERLFYTQNVVEKTTLLFVPVLNVESMSKSNYELWGELKPSDEWSDEMKEDINPDWLQERAHINRLLDEGNPRLNDDENSAYNLWIRRMADGNVVDPRGTYCASLSSL